MLQSTVAIGLGVVAVTASRTRRRERLAAFNEWVTTADLVELMTFCRNVDRPKRTGLVGRKRPSPRA